MIIKIVAAFLTVKGIDDFILQPNIYGKSVNAHPLEIFIVILIAGKVGGVWGMLFGVPAYTLLRIIVREFFAQYFIPSQENKEPAEEVPLQIEPQEKTNSENDIKE